ncbi:hypothetical protein H2201_001271 [Coniosporium apollinis]|uniref:DUF7905 domain-containing protein n=1 Tax=Coniosporium apollinis TaxID=61459 RepID=A0ABQ9P4Z9_9PEZI|nr:hypothetical protein H2201_001271 [Coniosporium apollinis]
MAHQWGLDQLDWDTFTSPQFKDDDFPPLSSSTGQSVMNRSSSSLNAADLATHIDRNAGATTPPLIDLESFDDNTSYVPAPVAISHDLEDLLLFSPVTERRSQVEVKAEEVSQHLSSRPSSSQASVPLNYGKPLDAEASFINIASLQQRKRKTKKEQQEEAERSMKHYFPIKESSHPVAADAFTEIPVPPLITPQRDNQSVAGDLHRRSSYFDDGSMGSGGSGIRSVNNSASAASSLSTNSAAHDPSRSPLPTPSPLAGPMSSTSSLSPAKTLPEPVRRPSLPKMTASSLSDNGRPASQPGLNTEYASNARNRSGPQPASFSPKPRPQTSKNSWGRKVPPKSSWASPPKGQSGQRATDRAASGSRPTTAINTNASTYRQATPSSGPTKRETVTSNPSLNRYAALAKGRQSQDLRMQRSPRPIAEPDNAGMAAYRARQKPAVRYPLPRNVNPYSTIKTNVAELRQESVYTNLAEIATATGTHIEKAMNVNREKGKNETGVYLDIRGTAEQAKIAIQEIEKWITAAYPGRSKPEWSKTAAVTDATKLKIRKQIRLEARRESFRQAPPESLESVSTARFPWPEDKVSFRPEQVLGSNLEALDPIRMDCQCYITLEKGSKFLQVLGENEEQVHSALQRLKVTCDQVLARNFEPAKIVFLMPLKDMACEIQLLPYGGPKVAGRYLNPEPIGRFPVIRRRDTESKRGKASRGSKSNSEASVLSSSSGSAPSLEDPQQDRIIIIGRLEEEVAWALQELRHFRGNLQLRVKLGTPVLTKYPKPKNKNDQYIYSVSEFAEIIENPEVESFVTQEIGHPGVGRHVLQRLVQNGHHLLCPEDPMASELKDVKPVFSGVFMIRSPDGSGDLRLQVDFKEEAGSYGTTPMRWCKAERGKKEPTLLLDASTVDLERGTAWHFGLTTTQGVEKTQLPKHYADFAFADWSVKLDAELAQKFGENHQYITFGRKGVPSTVPIQTVEQKTAWRFCIKGSAYICEVAKVSTVILGVRTQLNPPETQICEPRWSVSVWHSDWDVELQAHSKLKIGEEVPWTDAMPKFFPSNGYGEGDSEDGTGFQKLMGKLKRLEELVVGKVE